MKKRKLIGLASMMLALGVMAGCGNKGGKGDDPQPETCAHEYEFKSIDDAKHQEVCKLCGDVKANSAKNHSFSKDPAKVADNKAATCTEAGWEWQICKCGATKKKDVNALNHSYTKVKSTTATCTAAGENTMECSRCGAESPDKVAQAALDHDYVPDTSYTGLAASCTGAGTAQEKCSRCDATKIVETAALGHDYNDVAGTPANGYATLTTGTCKRDGCEGKRVYWDANELTDACKNDERVAREAVADNPDTEEDETVTEFKEPNYVEEGDGIRFWGRPIHNACVLQENGKPASQSAAAPVYDATITGSYFEYKINLANAMDSVKLIADMAPTSDLGTGELYKATSGDWTPGLIDSVDNKYNVRYALFIDDVEVAIDGTNSYPCPGSSRAWFTFPTAALNLAAGEHTIKLCMAGGYLSTYYAFGFERVVAPAHEHEYTKDNALSKDATCEEDGRFYGVCQCGLIKDEVLTKLGHNLVDDPKATDYEATCCYPGTAHKKCDRAGCTHEEDVELPALGHNFEADGEAITADGFATINPMKCARDNVERYVIDAKDVSDATKNNKRLVSAAVEDDLTTPDVDESAAAVYEDNYIENSDGSVKFYGRPIHNAMNLPATQNDHTSVYDENVVGSFIEYKFKVPAKIENVKLVAEIKPANYMRQNNVPMFSNPASISDDWTPGLSAEGEMYPTRYIVSLNGAVLEQDLTDDKVAVSDNREWYAFPLKDALSFEAGDYTLRITMAGGYECSFYNIGIQTQDPENTHQGGGNENPPVNQPIDLATSAATVSAGELQANNKLKGNLTWDATGIEAGEYSVKINAKMTSSSHGDRKWYNMAKAALCVNGEAEETLAQNPDTTAQDDYRYFMVVDGVNYYPESKDNWTTIGLTNTAMNKVEFVSKIVVKPSTTEITLAHGNIGFSLYVDGIELTKTGDYDPTIKVWNQADVDWGTISKKSGNDASGAALDMYKFGTNNEVTLTYNNEGAARDVMFRVFATTKKDNIGSCKVYEQTAEQSKYTVTVNGTAVVYSNEGVLPNKNVEGVDPIAYNIGHVGVVATAVTTINDNGIVADPIWFDFCVIHLDAGENTINFKKPNDAGYSIYFGGFALAEI